MYGPRLLSVLGGERVPVRRRDAAPRQDDQEADDAEPHDRDADDDLEEESATLASHRSSSVSASALS